MLVGSIDIGIRNIGFCVFDASAHTIKHLEIIDLLAIPRTKNRLSFGDQSVVFLVKRVIADRRTLFEQCDVVAVEKQMTRKMVLIQFAFECLLDNMTEVFQVPPRSVKGMFHTSRGKHALNKRAAIVKTLELLDAPSRAIVSAYKKKDDVCDAILQAFFVAERVG